MRDAQPSVHMTPVPGKTYFDVPGIRYMVPGGGRRFMVYPEDVAALEAAGCRRVVDPMAPPPGPPVNPATLPRDFAPLSTPHLKVRMLAPLDGHFRTMTVEGRTYSASAVEQYLDVPVEDARLLAANGWMDCGRVGPLTLRPDKPLRGETFIAEELGRVLIFDGHAWRDVITGMAS